MRALLAQRSIRFKPRMLRLPASLQGHLRLIASGLGFEARLIAAAVRNSTTKTTSQGHISVFLVSISGEPLEVVLPDPV